MEKKKKNLGNETKMKKSKNELNLGNETKKKKSKKELRSMEMEMETETETKRRRSKIISKKELKSMEMEMETETKRRRLMEESEDDSGYIPPEIITEILYRLPADSAIGCRCICKQWRSLIDHPSFRDTHTRQVISSSSTSNSERFGNYLIPNSPASSSGYFLYALQEDRKFHLQFVEYNDNDNVNDDEEKLVVPEFKPSKPITGHPFPFYNNCGFSYYNKWGSLMISSCNGLVFMAKTKPNYVNDMFVSNLFTREYLNLSLGNTITQDERVRRLQRKSGMAYGFGYLHSTNEYKAVSIYYHDSNRAKGEVSVYTLGSGRWRNKGEIPYCVYSELNPGGFFANGAIHWFTNTEKRRKIVSFDLADEEFRVVIPSPPQAPSADRVDELGVLGGCLCVTRSDKTRCEIPKDIWVLKVHTKENSKKKFLWNKRFSIPWKRITAGVKPYVILKSGKILLHGGTGLISYDPKTKAFNEDRQSFCDPWLKVIPYTKSFVSLKALGEKDAKCWGQSQALPHVKRRKTGQLRHKKQFKALAQQFRYRRDL